MWLFPVFSNHFELKITDLKFNLRSYFDMDPDLDTNIVMVNLDDYAKKQSQYDLWPYDYYAQTIELINAGEPTSLGIDIFFTLSVDTIGWKRLVTAVENSYVAINPYLIEFGDDKKPLVVSDHPEILAQLKYEELPQIEYGLTRHAIDIRYQTKRKFMDASAGLGIVNIEEDEDGILRRLPIISEVNGRLAPHFYLRLLCEHLSYKIENIEVVSKHKLIMHDFPIGNAVKNIEIPLDGNGNVLINYLSYEKIDELRLSGKFISVSAWDLITAGNPVDLKGKSVLFGDTSVPAKDHSITPIDQRMFNPLIYIIAMSNILNEEFITPARGYTTLLLVIGILSFLLVLAIKVDALRFALISVTLLIGYIVFNFTAFIYLDKLIPVLSVILPIIATCGFMLIYLVYQSQVTMGVLEGSLQSYLSPHLMDKIKNDPDMLKLGGERKRISVLFSDIAGFTSFTDKADPAEVQAVLEEYFSEMTSIVFANKGIVDKYMGDGIMAFFENPPEGVVSAQSAVKAAREMQNTAAMLDEKYKGQNRFPFSVYVGIATGYAKVGNIGPPEKVDYTVIGSVVNKASRLDGPGDAGDILMDEDTYFFVKEDYEIDDFGAHHLKGFEKPVQIYRLKRET
ncbi:MAG: adenylate/guanylate cyclase domain-containing protein [Candidatus Marinimicrobia bacterium]|nr:adenylate/guanylate cyclase domain-containing protein [Candidatus Neomarinimicrobiota bacterium]